MQARTIPPLVPPSTGGAPWKNDERAALATRLDLLFARSAAVRGAHVGLYAIDARDGSLLYARLGDDEFMPASTLKLLVGSVSLARLGSGFRFHTSASVAASGATVRYAVIRGGGDPFLRSADIDALAVALAARGVRELSSDLRVDDAYYDRVPYPPGWVWDDLPYYYAPVVSAATFEENVVHLTITPGAAAGDAAKVVVTPMNADDGTGPCPLGRSVRVRGSVATGPRDSDNTVDFARSGEGCIVVAGAVPLGSDPDDEDAAVVDPVVYLHDYALRALAAHGITLPPAATPPPPDDAPPPQALVPFWTHDSEPMPKILADMWFPSDNLVAELLLKALGVARAGEPGTSEHGVDAERDWLRGIGVDAHSVMLRDGSGLSIYDRITPRDLVAILQADWNGPQRETVLAALPVAGVRGTLREEFVDTPAAGRAYVKTGSMTHVRGLAGFLETRRHGAVTFALMVDDWNGDSAPLNAFRGAVLSALVGT